MNEPPNEVRSYIGEIIATGLMSTITSIYTSYSGSDAEYSGTGLLLSDKDGNTFCLTANHVVTPSSRTPPKKEKNYKHYYSEKFKREYSNVGLPSFGLLKKYWKSEICDLAILESCLNGHILNEVTQKGYYNISYLNNSKFPDIVNDDVFVVCGLPTADWTPIPATKENIHKALVYFFSGDEGSIHKDDMNRYKFKYDDDQPNPHGMSGSPVWLIREKDNKTSPIDWLNIESCINDNVPIKLEFTFVGIVVIYDPNEKILQAVRPEVCAEFSRQAQKKLPKFKNGNTTNDTHDILDWWVERYGRQLDLEITTGAHGLDKNYPVSSEVEQLQNDIERFSDVHVTSDCIKVVERQELFKNHIATLEPAAEAGDVMAQYWLGCIYEFGYIRKDNIDMAKHRTEDVERYSYWLEKAASSGFLGAIDNLIVTGVGDKADQMRAISSANPAFIEKVKAPSDEWYEGLQKIYDIVYK